jgi:hypothetical protein
VRKGPFLRGICPRSAGDGTIAPGIEVGVIVIAEARSWRETVVDPHDVHDRPVARRAELRIQCAAGVGLYRSRMSGAGFWGTGRSWGLVAEETGR